MASVNSFFYSTDPERQTLHKRITPNSEQQEEQQERWHYLRDFLLLELSEKFGCEVVSWLQGSYKFGTQVRAVKKGRRI